MNYIEKLEQVHTGEEFYQLLEMIDDSGLRFIRNRGYAEIDSLTLVDKYGRRYGNPAPLTLYNGIIGDDAYISYNSCDGLHTGKCSLRKCSKHLRLVEVG